MADENANNSDGTAEIPFYLMPVAAVLGTYALFGTFRILYLVYVNITYSRSSDKSSTTASSATATTATTTASSTTASATTVAIPPSTLLVSRGMAILLATVVSCMIGYAKIVALVNYAMLQNEYALFDPLDILGLTDADASNTTLVKQAYRNLSKVHHPDKPGGDATTFAKLHDAYRALTTDKDNYDAFGHPDGKLSNQQQQLAFALPAWLLHPQGTVAIVLLLLYFGMFIGLVYFVIAWTKQDEIKRTSRNSNTNSGNSMSVAGADTAYLAATLHPGSSHLDILLAIATTPEQVHLTQVSLDDIEVLKAARRQTTESTATKDKKNSTLAFDLDDGGDWAMDDDDDDDAKKAKQEEDLKSQAKQQLAEATNGAAALKLEGLDEGVLGQAWVEQALSDTIKKGGGGKPQWPPPDLRFLATKQFMYKGTLVSAMDHPAIRRNLCFTQGRLNAMMLNTHTELLEASGKKLIDQTYFKGSMEYRQRAGLLLEASLRIAVTMQSYRLTKTIVEAVSMFKIGVPDPLHKDTLAWFKSVMIKQYSPAGLPRLSITDLAVATPGEDEIATGDLTAITMTMERVHAEAFTKVKVAMCQKQGIPPQVALQTYREGWWVLVRAERMDDAGSTAAKSSTAAGLNPSNPLLQLLQEADKQKFEQESGPNRLLVAWPMIVQNMAQKSGKVKVQFKAPTVPGKYKLHLAVKSQEFLGSDQDFELEMTIVDVESVKREEDHDEEEDDDGEMKKDK